MFVQFDGAAEGSVISIFSCRQEDEITWPNQGEAPLTDPRIEEYIATLPDFVRATFESSSN